MPHRAILVGAGAWGEYWCRDFLPPNIRDGLLDVVAVVDPDPAALNKARKRLDLRQNQTYPRAKDAFRQVDADFCINVVPPAQHEAIVDLALEHGLHILSEKPLADSLEASIRIVDKVQRSGLKMAVTMSHRFDQDKTTLRETLREDRWGGLDYLSARLACSCRPYGSWGADFRHEMKDPLLLEGAIHHLDLLADLAQSSCRKIFAQTWTPPWAQYRGDCNAFVQMTFDNGVRAIYEGAMGNAAQISGWSEEYIRAECEKGTLVLDQRRLDAFPYDPRQTFQSVRAEQGQSLPLLSQPKWANTWLVEKFIAYLGDRIEMETKAKANLQSVMLVFAAMASRDQGKAIDVPAFAARAVRDVLGQ